MVSARRSVVSRLPVYGALLSHVPLRSSRPLVTPPPLSLLAQLGEASRYSASSLEGLAGGGDATGADCVMSSEYSAAECSFSTASYGELHYLTLQLYAHLDDHWVRLKMAHLALPPAFDLIRTPAGGVASFARPLLRKAQAEFYARRKHNGRGRLRLASVRDTGLRNRHGRAVSQVEQEEAVAEPIQRDKEKTEEQGRSSPGVRAGILVAASLGGGGQGFMSEEGPVEDEQPPVEVLAEPRSSPGDGFGADRGRDFLGEHMRVDIGQASDVSAEEEVAFATACGIPLPAFWDSYYACLRVAKQHCVEFPLRTAIELVLNRYVC